MKTKLHLLLALALSLFLKAEAQFVTIPDPDFVQWLTLEYPSCMNGNLMDTTCTEILATTSLGLNGQTITDATGVQYFDSLISLSFTGIPGLTFIPTLPA